MSIWQNKKYREFENKVGEDVLRGQARNDFPWTILTHEQKDLTGDLWKLSALCLNLIPNEHNNELEAHLRFEGRCELGEDSMLRLGFDPERLKSLNEHVNAILTAQEIKVKVTMPKLEVVSKTLLARFGNTLIKMYGDARKARSVRENLEKRPICRFAV